MSFIATGAALAGTIIGIVLVIIVAIMIIVAVVNWYVQNQEYVQRNVKNVKEVVPDIVDSITKLCGLEDHIMSQLDQAFANTLVDPKAREIANRIIQGEKLSDCDWYEFINHLNEWEKRKLRVYDFICDLSSCLK
ncbi:hypothetical protein BD31_I0915 [Candidatus Nitrosopumilus salaria BD31]|uniref:Uncharacterized protein n=1 Tax=Candidatus Nitrosopumilus salarius BD31 TaxID=859350 RepID=I3CZK4_9ARCH|nr:hypothetical protein [Candidatus Nitrosopumilus salaria]EIJ64897.1 hypothetical protein BD31_I0915 [Candidatus Nitrosopumilus salaria BD31]